MNVPAHEVYAHKPCENRCENSMEAFSLIPPKEGRSGRFSCEHGPCLVYLRDMDGKPIAYRDSLGRDHIAEEAAKAAAKGLLQLYLLVDGYATVLPGEPREAPKKRRSSGFTGSRRAK